MAHFKKVCQHGHVHGQCRCTDPNKSIIHIDCPNTSVEDEYQPKHRAD